jgi:MFS family permease
MLLLDRSQQAVMLLNFALFASFSSIMTVFPLHATAVMGDTASASQVGMLFGISALVGFGGAPLGGYLADSVGRKATILPAGALIAAGAVSTTVDLSSALDLDLTAFQSLVPAVMLWGLGNSLMNPAMAAFAADIARDDATRGQALSLSRMAGDGAFLIAPVGLGTIAQLTTCETALHTSAAVVGFSTLAFAVLAREETRGAAAGAAAGAGAGSGVGAGAQSQPPGGGKGAGGGGGAAGRRRTKRAASSEEP